MHDAVGQSGTERGPAMLGVQGLDEILAGGLPREKNSRGVGSNVSIIAGRDNREACPRKQRSSA